MSVSSPKLVKLPLDDTPEQRAEYDSIVSVVDPKTLRVAIADYKVLAEALRFEFAPERIMRAADNARDSLFEIARGMGLTTSVKELPGEYPTVNHALIATALKLTDVGWYCLDLDLYPDALAPFKRARAQLEAIGAKGAVDEN